MTIGQQLHIMSSLRLESRPALLRLAIVLVLELDVEQLTPSSKSRSGRTRVQRARYRYKPQGWHRMLHVFFLQLVMKPELKLRLTLARMSTVQ